MCPYLSFISYILNHLKWCRIDIYLIAILFKSISFKIYFSLLIFALIHHVKDLFYNLYFEDYIVENNGFEPLTPCVQGRCSSQLS